MSKPFSWRAPDEQASRPYRAFAMLMFIGVLASACGQQPEQPARESADATQETVTWRAKHEADYRRGWSTIAGLHFLNPGGHMAGSGPRNDIVLPPSVPAVLGKFVLEGEMVRFEPA